MATEQTQNQSARTSEQIHELESVEGPPQAPEVQKRLEFTRTQWIGIPLILLIPLLAMFQLFGETSSQVILEGSDLQVVLEYPTTLRYKQLIPMEFAIQNLSASTVPTVTVGVDSDYLSFFSTVRFTPSVDEVTGEFYKVYLTDIKPEEVRLVTVELQGEKYWQHTGQVVVQPAEGESLTTEVSTFIFP